MEKRTDSLKDRFVRVGFAVALLSLPTLKAVRDVDYYTSSPQTPNAYVTETTRGYMESERQKLNDRQREDTKELRQRLNYLRSGRIQ